MGLLDLPEDLVAFLRAGSPATLDAGGYGTLTLFRPDALRIETLCVRLTNSPVASEDPHREEFGHYPVPAVNLIRGSPRTDLDFPAWMFLWLPNERRYGSFDLDHGDLLMFAPSVRWADIVADPEPFALVTESGGDGRMPVEPLRPWLRYTFVAEEYPFNDKAEV
jgi:hypothetical protein